ncbi:hypothetical protein ACUR5C_11625 [Aliikangiella sp. IMCC44653]
MPIVDLCKKFLNRVSLFKRGQNQQLDSQNKPIDNYDVRLKVEEGLLRYYISGQRNYDAAIQMWERIYQDCRVTGINKIHATVLLSGQIEKMKIPQLINRLIELNNQTPILCAWVDHNSQSYVDNLVGERLPRPSQMNVRIFNNDDDAKAWLEKNSANHHRSRQTGG